MTYTPHTSYRPTPRPTMWQRLTNAARHHPDLATLIVATPLAAAIGWYTVGLILAIAGGVR